ncbi:MAG TPA: type II toxin-antitoxin system RelE/ParE family toxin [Candidatus Dormibacteraeota bacterium]|nr:type II toxin-antitoxin system RelE/ParE family toxin [Candidatus Dormibacteraeota bacterium]
MSSKKSLTHHKKVISYTLVPVEWTFCDYSTAAGNPIENWVAGLSEDAENLFWSVLKNNRKVQNPIDWTQLRYLQGDAKKHRLWELRFKADDKAYRVIGFFSDDRRKTAILLMGCFHKQKVYDPPGAINTAITRKGKLEKGEAIAIERKIPTDR